MLLSEVVIFVLLLNIEGYRSDISVNFNIFPSRPNFDDYVTFKSQVLVSADLDILPSNFNERIKNATFLWYSKNDDEYGDFTLLNVGRSMTIKADSFFNAIYNLTMIIDKGQTIVDYSRKVFMRPALGMEVSINNHSFHTHFNTPQTMNSKYFDFRCKVIGGPTHFNIILPSSAYCKGKNVEIYSDTGITDFIFSNCKIILQGKYGCKISNEFKEFTKTFIIMENMPPLKSAEGRFYSVSLLLVICMILLGYGM